MNEKSQTNFPLDSIRIDRGSSIPLSKQVEDHLTELIRNGSMRPGDPLPHETEWSERLGINRTTLRIALGRLAEDGLIIRRKRAGSFVADPIDRINNIGYFYLREASVALVESLHHIQERLEAHGYDLKVVAFPYDYYEDVDLLDEMRRRDLSGAILTTMSSPSCLNDLRLLEKKNFPYVRLGNKFFIGQLRAPLISGDNQQGLRDALDYLLRLGHRNIGYISHESYLESHQTYRTRCERTTGCKPRWLRTFVYEDTEAGWSRFDPYPPMRDYLERNPELTAIMLDSCRFWEPVVRIANELGRRVPETMSLISLGGRPLVNGGSFLDVTHMQIPRVKQAELAVDHLLDVIENGLPPREKVTLVPFKLIEGGTAAAPPSEN